MVPDPLRGLCPGHRPGTTRRHPVARRRPMRRSHRRYLHLRRRGLPRGPAPIHVTSSVDLGCSATLLSVIALGGIAWTLRRARTVAFQRIDADGGSALLGRQAMGAGYWALQPAGRWLASAGITPDAITLASLVPGLGAGVALGFGHLGLGALLASLGFLGDALDGMVARATGTASDAGEVVDAAADRWGEFAFIAGVAVAYRGTVGGLVLALGALSGAFMVSYATAKAEALRVEAPRGMMRRAERAVYLTLAAALTPWSAWLAGRHGLGDTVGQAPMLTALALVAVLGNGSAIRRLKAVRDAVRAREAE